MTHSLKSNSVIAAYYWILQMYYFITNELQRNTNVGQHNRLIFQRRYPFLILKRHDNHRVERGEKFFSSSRGGGGGQMPATELILEYNDIKNVYFHNVGSPFPQQKRGPCSGL